ncbi:cytochrome b [Phaeobacter inhibens]|uniref:cytochrome b n=1 Tax=Phaeobacter inhibens TaxID=221822 RepID=UPI00076BBDEE|nr:cytochrome b/b6 domain-containing protein [Phaeobacter inhibens]KXF88973.1 cytochrome B [Phaeobacter inhibens]WHP67563.1 cytochrome b/b6 domain-containing protein [Phaeobacter inhibens]
MKSRSNRYGTVAITIHWLSAPLICALLASGFRAAGLTDGDAKIGILSAHVPMGITILALTLVRIAWWVFADSKPASPKGDPIWQSLSAKAVHLLFYVVILGMAASGIGMLALSGAGAIILGAAAGDLPNFHDYAPRIPHGIGARAIVGLLVLHVGAALYHHFIKRDGLIWRIWYGSRADGDAK